MWRTNKTTHGFCKSSRVQARGGLTEVVFDFLLTPEENVGRSLVGWVRANGGVWGVTLHCNLPFPTAFGCVFSGCRSTAGVPFAPNSFDQAASSRPTGRPGFPFHNNPDWRQSLSPANFPAVSYTHTPHPYPFATGLGLPPATVAASSVTLFHLSHQRLIVSAVCAVLASVSGCWYRILRTRDPPPHYPTSSPFPTPSSSLLLLLLTRCCLTLPRNNPPPLLPQSLYNPVNLIPSTPTTTDADPLPPSRCPFRSILPHAGPLIYSVCSNREYPRMARDSGHVEHGTNVAAVSLTLPEPHLPNPTLSHFNLLYFLQRFLFWLAWVSGFRFSNNFCIFFEILYRFWCHL